MTHPLETWKGEFGKDYTDRNVIDYLHRLPSFQRILDRLPIKRVLEVGCNRGHNLVALTEILKGSEVIGIEPNRYALELALAKGLSVLPGDVLDLPFKDGYFDLVFTANVLIHLELSDLTLALAEIYRTSNHYILAIEYFAEEETVIPYHSHDNLLWKRNFLKHYQGQFPGLTLIRKGYLGPEEGFDRSHWWLLEKR